MKFLVILGLTIALPTLVLSLGPKCHTRELMKCVDIGVNYYISLPKRSLPDTDKAIERECKEYKKAFACVDKYLKTCLPPWQKEIVDIIYESNKGSFTKFCIKGTPLREMYDAHVGCVNNATQVEKVYYALKNSIEYNLATLENFFYVPSDQKLVYGCCAYGRSLYFVRDIIGEYCGEAAALVDRKILDIIYSHLSEIVCNGFTGKEPGCKEVLPPKDSKPSDSFKRTELYKFTVHMFQNWL